MLGNAYSSSKACSLRTRYQPWSLSTSSHTCGLHVAQARLADQQLNTPSTPGTTNRHTRIEGVLLDIDGVVCCADKDGDQAVPSAADALKELQAMNVPYKFVTNTTTHRRAGVAARLQRCGIPCRLEDIITPAVCATLHIKQHDLGTIALFVNPQLLPDFSDVRQLPQTAEAGAAAVVVGDMGDRWTYETLNRAFRLLMQQPAPQLLSLGKSRYFKAHDGLSLDVGPFTAALEFATGTKATVLGKPAPSVFQLAAKTLDLKPEQVVMVGDDVIGDVGGAQQAGCKGVLVQTGKYRAGDDEGEVRPDAVLASVAAFPEWLGRYNMDAAGA